jgi:hypothetical protein
MNAWELQRRVSRRLLVWSGLSVAAGIALLFAGPFWVGVGIEAVAWGVVDAAIALLGGWVARRRRARLPDPDAPDVLDREARSLRRLLLINTGLDVLYVVGGVALALTLGADNLFWRGNGWGIVIQGGFLFLFDLVHALLIRGEGRYEDRSVR